MQFSSFFNVHFGAQKYSRLGRRSCQINILLRDLQFAGEKVGVEKHIPWFRNMSLRNKLLGLPALFDLCFPAGRVFTKPNVLPFSQSRKLEFKLAIQKMTLTNNNPIACQPEREREREMIKEKN
jgi:hypothetical protein